MKMIRLKLALITLVVMLGACKKEKLHYSSGDIEVSVKTGENWSHNFPLFMGFNKKNPPQFAIWIEDSQGNYITTIFATYKIATEGWISNKGNRRKESLPHWCYKRGITYNDGLMLPTKNTPLTDGITGATPKSDSKFKVKTDNLKKPFVIKAEFNHSTDFNSHYPKDAKKGDNNYSGGKEGSGQPAVVYSATINEKTTSVIMQFIGHSSPDGSNGKLYYDTNNITSAKTIVENIVVTVKH
jgi:hypothetical protein